MRWLARLWFRLAGWRYAGTKPNVPKFVAIGAPHTTNWDFVVFLAVASHFDMKAKAIGKHTLVQGPFGGLMRRLGIIPVDRSSPQGVVEQMVDAFDAADELALVIAPEGTRSAEPYWRSGFYRIAVAAGVPLVMAKIEAPKKVVTLSDPLELTGDVSTDMDRVRAFYAGAVGLKPHGDSTIRLRDEDAPGGAD